MVKFNFGIVVDRCLPVDIFRVQRLWVMVFSYDKANVAPAAYLFSMHMMRSFEFFPARGFYAHIMHVLINSEELRTGPTNYYEKPIVIPFQ